ncbi:unnamed protein product [Heligmosomoides polygyrus]|uniref:WASH-7_N domain-containing protein n=1 Tax=Heligmosomoides polygyrus TaxID=6339 RepID=A0A183FZE9_HELPZ|nr:unnamed protein product [Heligmosomoides polygyrus]
MENYWSHYRGQVDDLKSKIARISRLSAILNSGLVNLNGAVTCIANSRFVEQRLGEDESPKILPSDQVMVCIVEVFTHLTSLYPVYHRTVPAMGELTPLPH